MGTHVEAERLTKGLVAGLAGGLAATLVMTQMQSLMKQAQRKLTADEEAHNGSKGGKPKKSGKKKEESAEPATKKVATAVSEKVLRRELTESEKRPAGEAVHYGFGTLMGGAYGVLAEALPVTTTGFGTAFGAGLWAVADEVAVPALGLGPSPKKTPLAQHGYALVSHLVYGAVTEGVRRGVLALLDPPRPPLHKRLMRHCH